MNNKIIRLLNNAWARLVFALLSGTAYYIIVLKFILSHTSVGGGLLGFFFLPAIVCGAALVLIKVIRQCIEDGREGSAVTVFWLHVVFMIIAAVSAIAVA